MSTMNNEKAIVRHSYDADNEDELTLKAGEIVTIISKDAEDPGWWKGELNGKVGVFPDNFVEIVHTDEFGTDKVLRPSTRFLHKTEPQPRPKKPPPPATAPAAQSPAVKLPEKTATVEPAHTEKHVKKKEDLPSVEKSAPPALPGKKPSVPPPLLRKPAKPDPPRPTSMIEHKITPPTVKEELPKEMSQSYTEEKKPSGHFDEIQSSTDKLTHLTATRPKGPSKRPPSQVFNHTEEERNGDVSSSHWVKEEKTVHSKRISPPPVKEEPPHKHDKGGSSHPPARPPEPTATVPTAAITSLHTAIEELKKEVQHLKTNTVSKAAFEEIKQENEKLRLELDGLKSSSNRKFRDIINEVDDEKKIRLSTQVEIERIKKLVNESHV